MLRFFGNKKGQSTAEYAILISVVIAAIMAMQTYAKRALQANVRGATANFTSSVLDNNAAGWDSISAQNSEITITKDYQYEPTELESQSTQNILEGSTEKKRLITGGGVNRTSVEKTVGEAGDYQKYNYTAP